MNKERVMIIKLSVKPDSDEALVARARKAWKINLDTIIKKGITHVVVMYQQQVIADYTLGDQAGYYLSGPDAGRVWFDLKDYAGDTPLKGKRFDYKTANPATTKDLQELLDLEIRQVAPDDVDYVVGSGGSVTITYRGNAYQFEITEEYDDNDDTGIRHVEVKDVTTRKIVHVGTINEAYNENSLDDKTTTEVEQEIKRIIATRINGYLD